MTKSRATNSRGLCGRGGVESEGSTKTRSRGSPRRSDLRLVFAGMADGGEGRRNAGEMMQSTTSLARACAVFLRKVVLGEARNREARLLDGVKLQSRLTDRGLDRDLSVSRGPLRGSDHEKAAEPNHKSRDMDMVLYGRLPPPAIVTVGAGTDSIWNSPPLNLNRCWDRALAISRVRPVPDTHQVKLHTQMPGRERPHSCIHCLQVAMRRRSERRT